MFLCVCSVFTVLAHLYVNVLIVLDISVQACKHKTSSNPLAVPVFVLCVILSVNKLQLIKNIRIDDFLSHCLL